MHPLINPKVFISDAAFDTFGKVRHFHSAFIPLNKLLSLVDLESSINEKHIPCCPNDSSLLLKKEGNNTTFLKNGITRQKFICPLSTWDKCGDEKYCHICHCKHSCASFISGRMVYIYLEKNLRTYPGTLCGTDEQDSTCKIQIILEKDINYVKENLFLAE